MKKLLALFLSLALIVMACPTACAVEAKEEEAWIYLEEIHAVDLQSYLPNARFNLLFASDQNITGRALYEARPILEEKTAKKLLAAAEKFAEDGYGIVIYDAYRPMSAQWELWEIVRDAKYIADPNDWGSWHQRGRAVDISLYDLETGEELEMPTPMHTFDAKASRFGDCRKQWTEAAKENSDYMTRVMLSCGFETISTEWWHFQYTGRSYSLPTDLDLSLVVR